VLKPEYHCRQNDPENDAKNTTKMTPKIHRNVSSVGSQEYHVAVAAEPLTAHDMAHVVDR
jgi:hypothetical protein